MTAIEKASLGQAVCTWWKNIYNSDRWNQGFSFGALLATAHRASDDGNIQLVEELTFLILIITDQAGGCHA